jgi:hypothetical protein
MSDEKKERLSSFGKTVKNRIIYYLHIEDHNTELS